MANEGEELSDSLSEFQRRFAQLPEIEEPPQTTFQVINRSSREVYWNRMLSYLLDPTEPHGFDTELLERFLRVLKKTQSSILSSTDATSRKSKSNRRLQRPKVTFRTF